MACAADRTRRLIGPGDADAFARYLGVDLRNYTGLPATGTRDWLVARVVDRMAPALTRYASPRDLVLSDPRAVAGAHEVDDWARALAYCPDFKQQRLLFTLGEAEAVPFLYMSQRDTAERVVSVPFARLAELGGARDMTPFFVLSPGRCASTLLARLLQVAGHPTLSEPDVFTACAVRYLFGAEEIRAEDHSLLLRATLESFRVQFGTAPVIKLRGVACFAIEPLLAAFPTARWVFVTRERLQWARSCGQAFGFSARNMAFVYRAAELANEHALAAGVAPTLISHEQLAATPVRVIEDLLGELTQPKRDALALCARSDSQEGTPLARSALRAKSVSTTQASLDAFEREYQRVAVL